MNQPRAADVTPRGLITARLVDIWREPSRPAGWLLPARLYLSLLVPVTIVSCLAINLLGPGVGKAQYGFKGGAVLGGWANWDAGWYYGIASHGYRHHSPGVQSPVAFFPGYAVAARIGGWLVGDIGLAAVMITVACGLGSAVAFWIWCRDRMDHAAAKAALMSLLVYPYGYYLYGAVYGTALFLLVVLLAFLAVERDHLLLAGVAGAAATFTRFVGVAVVVGLVVHILEQRGALRLPERFGRHARLRLRALRPRDGLVLLSATGLAGYATYLWVRFGDPLLFSSVQRHWGQAAGPRTWLKVAFFEQLFNHPDRLLTWGLVVQGAIGFTVLALVPAVGRHFGWGYGAYLAVVALLALFGSKDFQGLGRYMIAAFPVFGLLGIRLAERQALRPVILAASGLALLLMTAGFAHGLYLS